MWWLFYYFFFKIKLYQFIWVILSCDFVWKIKILKFKNMETWNNILKEHMISNEKVMNIKVVQLIKIYNFYFGHLSMWLCLNNSKFEFQETINSNNILKHQMIWTEKAMKIKVVVLIEIYNFYFGHIFIRQSVSTHCSQIDISLI